MKSLIINKTQMYFILVPLAVCTLLMLSFVFYQFMLWDLARCYDMPPWEFKAQSELIQQGMSEKEAVNCIEGYNEIKYEENYVELILKPKRKAYLNIAILQGVTITFDSNRKVLSVRTWDG